MAIIYTYPPKSIPALNDLVLISDMSTKKNLTKSTTVSAIVDLATVTGEDPLLVTNGVLSIGNLPVTKLNSGHV